MDFRDSLPLCVVDMRDDVGKCNDDRIAVLERVDDRVAVRVRVAVLFAVGVLLRPGVRESVEV